MDICSIYRLCNPKGCCYLRLNAQAAPLSYPPPPTPPPQIRPCSFLPSYFTSKIKASANPITGCQSRGYRRNSSQGESLARISLHIFIQQCDAIESSLSLWSHLVTVFIHFLAQLPGKISQFVFGRLAASFLTSRSRVRERLVMGTGLMEAERTGGCGEEEEDDVRMGGEAEVDRVGG